MILKPLQSRPIVSGVSAIRTVLSSCWPALLIAVGQGLVMYLVVHFGLGLDVAHVAGAIAFVILIGATYLAIIQMFNAIFGIPVGRVLTLAFLMVQMVSSGGIYPVETTARPFQILHPFDPMTYAVNGMRQLINGGVDERLPIAVAVLLGCCWPHSRSARGRRGATGCTRWTGCIRRSRCESAEQEPDQADEADHDDRRA